MPQQPYVREPLMLGVHHAGTGAAAWVAVTAVSPLIPALGILPLDASAVAIGGLVAAGAALLPDADHPNATIAYSLPGAKLVTGAIGAASGGHRHGTHSGLSAALVIVLAWWLTTISGWVNQDYLSTYVVFSGIAAAALLAFALKVLKIVRSWGMSWLVAIASAALITLVLPGQWAWLPWAIAIGWVTHMAGDFLTTGGLPLLWPLKVSPSKAWSNTPVLSSLWSAGGYFAFPILGNTGSWRETMLAVPLTLYGFYGIVISALSLLPFFPTFVG